MNTQSEKEIVNFSELDKLAKLLATEDIIVEHRPVQTASFDTSRRILTLPVWKNMTRILYHMLVEHEIGHAHFTPNEAWINAIKDLPQIKQFLNVLEDSRIERMMKNKYPGSRRDFREGYLQLYNEDFFKLKGQDISKMSFIDRINIYYKLGDNLSVSFSDKEQEIISKIDKMKSFEDVNNLSREIYDMAVEENNKKQLDSYQNTFDESQKDDTKDFKEESDEYKYEELVDETVSETVDNLENSIIENLIDEKSIPVQYLYIDPYSKWQSYVYDYKKLLTSLEKHNTDFRYKETSCFAETRKKNIRMVNYLIKQFEMKKAADNYIRSRESKTGVLNSNKLHSYKLTDDIFRRITINPQSKKHGILMFVDFSMSMADNFKGTIEQLMTLVLFCRKVGISHRVYGFSTNRNIPLISDTQQKIKREFLQKCADKLNKPIYSVDSHMCLLELFNEKMSLSQFRLMAEGLLHYHKIEEFRLCGSTPLNSSMILARKMLKDFKKELNLQIVSSIFLTDGGNNIKSIILPTGYPWTTFGKYSLLDMTSKKVFPSNCDITESLITLIKNDGCRTISFRIGKTSDITQPTLDVVTTMRLKKQFRKENCVSINNFKGYEQYNFIKGGDDLLTDEFSIDVPDGASNSKIAKAFINSRNDRSFSRSILTKFIDKIAA